MKRILVISGNTALTGAFVATETFSIASGNQLMLYVNFKRGQSEGMELYIEFSQDRVDFYKETSVRVSPGEVIVSASPRIFLVSDMYRLPVPVSDCYFRVRVRARGAVVDGAAVGIGATLERMSGNFH